MSVHEVQVQYLLFRLLLPCRVHLKLLPVTDLKAIFADVSVATATILHGLLYGAHTGMM